jgi:hypothetical protein
VRRTVVVAAALLSLSLVAPTQVQARRLVWFEPSVPVVGQTYEVHGEGFRPNRDVIVAASYPTKGTWLWTGPIGADGTFLLQMVSKEAGTIQHDVYEESPTGDFRRRARVFVTMVNP